LGEVELVNFEILIPHSPNSLSADRQAKFQNIKTCFMIRNYLKTAWRFFAEE
jgi:hypothetical protein